MKRSFILFSLGIAGLIPAGAQEAPDLFPERGGREENYTMRVTARVIDEDGKPLANTPIRIGIHNVNDYKDMYNDFRGVTDAEGKFSAEGIGRGLAKIEVTKKGCYPSRRTIECYEGTAEQIRATGRFIPWDPVVDMMVKKVGKPVPMLVRLGDSTTAKALFAPQLSQMGKELGWDLVEGDWVAPEGTGKVPDLILKFTAARKGDHDGPGGGDRSAHMTLRMGNPDDGFVVLQELKGEESLLRLPRSAPSEGYDTKKLEFSWSFKDDQLTRTPIDMPKGYLFRLRTKKDPGGKVTSAIYGKVSKPFEVHPSLNKNGDVVAVTRFDYYLNLTPNDRNLEYDQKSNLAPEADKGLYWPP